MLSPATNVKGDMSPPTTQSKKRPLPRARQACLRCRKQKLRCDDTRPCALCVRVGIECTERPENKRLAQSPTQHEGRPNPTVDHLSDQAQLPISPQHAASSSLYASPASLSSRRGQPTAPPQTSPRESGKRLSEIYTERTSTYEVVDQLFREHNSSARLTYTADAIPGGSPDARAHDAGAHYLSARDVLGCELPSSDVIEFCLESYLDAVHWFMLLFHEPSLRAGIQTLVTTGTVRADRFSFLILVALIIGVGAKYATKAEAEERLPGFDLDGLGDRFIRKSEERLLDVFDEAHIEAIQISMILSSYYIYHSRPNRCLALNGSAQKLALSMGLHRESSWKMQDPVVREVWRRLCWALYTAEV